MKKILLLGIITLLALPAVSVATIDPGRAPTLITVENAITIIFNAAFWLLLAVAGVFFLYGAFNFLLGGQDPKNAERGKNIITYAIIALVVAILARGLAAFIPRMFGIQ